MSECNNEQIWEELPALTDNEIKEIQHVDGEIIKDCNGTLFVSLMNEWIEIQKNISDIDASAYETWVKHQEKSEEKDENS